MTASLGESKIQRRTLTLLGGIGALQAASCKLQAASCKLQAASCKSVGAWVGVSSSSWGFRWVYRLFVAGQCSVFFEHKNKIPVCVSRQGFWNLILTMTYSHMGKPHTT
ncbi:hypothetical protein, partial [Pseudomonas sp. FSL R10-2245]|uniref:hypothetical protein n=1 Tax=Pseudomonas sp. FSL R10-2245 TaxID=2662200 RepID=UPI001C49B5E4